MVFEKVVRNVLKQMACHRHDFEVTYCKWLNKHAAMTILLYTLLEAPGKILSRCLANNLHVLYTFISVYVLKLAGHILCVVVGASHSLPCPRRSTLELKCI